MHPHHTQPTIRAYEQLWLSRLYVKNTERMRINTSSEVTGTSWSTAFVVGVRIFADSFWFFTIPGIKSPFINHHVQKESDLYVA
jgi:hypothetical protein